MSQVGFRPLFDLTLKAIGPIQLGRLLKRKSLRSLLFGIQAFDCRPRFLGFTTQKPMPLDLQLLKIFWREDALLFRLFGTLDPRCNLISLLI